MASAGGRYVESEHVGIAVAKNGAKAQDRRQREMRAKAKISQVPRKGSVGWASILGGGEGRGGRDAAGWGRNQMATDCKGGEEGGGAREKIV